MPPDILKDRIRSVKNQIQQTERDFWTIQPHRTLYEPLESWTTVVEGNLIKSQPDKVHFLLVNEQQEADSTCSGAI